MHSPHLLCDPVSYIDMPISVFVAGCDGADPCNETQTTPTLAPAPTAPAPAAESAAGTGKGNGQWQGSGKGNGCRPRFNYRDDFRSGGRGRRTRRSGGRGGRRTEDEARQWMRQNAAAGEDEDAAVGEDAAPAAPGADDVAPAAEDAAEDAAPAPAPCGHQPTTSAPAESASVSILIRRCLPGDDETHTHIDADPEWRLKQLVEAYARQLGVEVGLAVPELAHCMNYNYGRSQLRIGPRVRMWDLWAMSRSGVVIIDVLPRPAAASSEDADGHEAANAEHAQDDLEQQMLIEAEVLCRAEGLPGCGEAPADVEMAELARDAATAATGAATNVDSQAPVKDNDCQKRTTEATESEASTILPQDNDSGSNDCEGCMFELKYQTSQALDVGEVGHVPAHTGGPGCKLHTPDPDVPAAGAMAAPTAEEETAGASAEEEATISAVVEAESNWVPELTAETNRDGTNFSVEVKDLQGRITPIRIPCGPTWTGLTLRRTYCQINHVPLSSTDPSQFRFYSQFAGTIIIDTMHLNSLQWSSHTASRVNILHAFGASLPAQPGDEDAGEDDDPSQEDSEGEVVELVQDATRSYMEDSTNFRSDSTNSESWAGLVEAIAGLFDEVGTDFASVAAFADHRWYRLVRGVFDAKIAASLQAAREGSAAAPGPTATLNG